MLQRITEWLVAWWKIPVTIVELEDDVRLTLAARQRDIYVKSHENCVNHTIQVSIWMIGTLLVLNSGALASIFSSENARKGSLDASWFFVVGICFAMLNGWLIQVVNLSNVRPCLIGSAYWDTIANGRAQNLQFEEDMERAELRRIRIAKFVQAPGWFSMGCFLAGVWELARFFPG
jgi:hypothetical protein